MKISFFKRGVVLSAFLAMSGILCARDAIKGYEGELKTEEELMAIRYTGNAMVIYLWIFKADGNVTSDLSSFGYTYNSAPEGNIYVRQLEVLIPSIVETE